MNDTARRRSSAARILNIRVASLLTLPCVCVATVACHPSRTHRAEALATDSAAQQRASDSAFEALVIADVRRPFPSDSQLKERFAQHSHLFDQLVAMAQTDRELVRIASDFTWTTKTVAWPRPDAELGFTHERWNEYRRLFQVLGLEAGLLQRPQDAPSVIYLMAQTKGLVTSGSVKGYAYADAQLEPQCESLDMPRGSGREGICFKPLAPHWYLYLEWD